jgi:hypothetical protein
MKSEQMQLMKVIQFPKDKIKEKEKKLIGMKPCFTK